jgi:hypothetical protein
MKNTKILFAALLLAGVTASGAALAQDGVTQDALTAGAYCHSEFPAMHAGSLGDEQPALKNADTGDRVDFYGPCDVNPTGADQIQQQRLDDQFRKQIENE